MAEASLRERRRTLLARADLQGLDFCRAYSAEADAWISSLAEHATGGSTRHVALLAVGGYGRGELCPFSDLDIVLVHNGRRDIARVADAIWYPVWDEGVHLDHSVRRPAQVLDAAASDLRVALGLLDARLVWGDERTAEPLIARSLAAWKERLGALWLPDLISQMAERQDANGDVAFLLEPDLKESHGGLRDAHVLQALRAWAPLISDYVDLAAIGPAIDILTRARVELHRVANREQDRLLLQEQDAVAVALDYDDADRLMAVIAEAGRAIAWEADDAWRRRTFWQPDAAHRHRLRRRERHPTEPDGAAPGAGDDPLDVESGVVIVSGPAGDLEAALSATALIAEDPSIPFRLAAVAAEHHVPIARGSLHRLADRLPPAPNPWPPGVRDAMVRLLSSGRPAIVGLEALDHHGILVRLLPDWTAVRNRPQRNSFHRFTVDRHLLETAAGAASLVDRVDRPDLLLVGALLHDIGKGFPGDHTDVGIDRIGEIGPRMGFSPADVAILQAMCRHHLLLPDTATRRDLDDPTTIARVADAAGDLSTLRLLAALTEADSIATGSSAWGTWKAGLVDELVRRAARLLGVDDELELASTGRGVPQEMVDLVLATAEPVVRLDPPRVFVAAPDRPGLLAAVAGVLALHGLNVRSADVTSDRLVATEVFVADVIRGNWPEPDRLARDLASALVDPATLGDRLAAKAREYGRPRRASAAHPVQPSVTVDLDASDASTVLEVRAPDVLGLLHRITQVLADAGLDVITARVSTFGDVVVDAFYVRDAHGAKLTDGTELTHITTALETAIVIGDVYGDRSH